MPTSFRLFDLSKIFTCSFLPFALVRWQFLRSLQTCYSVFHVASRWQHLTMQCAAAHNVWGNRIAASAELVSSEHAWRLNLLGSEGACSTVFLNTCTFARTLDTSCLGDTSGREWVLTSSEGVWVYRGPVHEWGWDGARHWPEDRSSRGNMAFVVSHWCEKKGAEPDGKVEIYRSIYIPTLIYGQEQWVMTERMSLWMQAAKIGLSGGWVASPLEIGWQAWWFGVEPLLFCVERNQLRWLGHPVRMPPRRILGRCFWHV